MANADDVKTTAKDDAVTEETNETVEEKKEPVVLTKELEEKIVRQIEYYFGNINLPRDKFLQEQIALEDGWVPISVLLTFKRLLSICSDVDTIAQALLNTDNNLIIVSEDRKKIRRNPDMPAPVHNEERRQELMTRTAYVKGFSNKEQLEPLMKFFEEFGPCESVYMRSYKDKLTKEQVFKGSVFVIFKNVDDCKSFLEKEEVKYNDVVLIRKWQSQYFEDKKKEREERNEKRGKKKNSDSDKVVQRKHNFPKGVILHMTGFKDTTTRDSIKTEVVKIYEKEPAYITYGKGDTEGYIRFSEENGAVDFVAKLTDSKMTINDSEITVRALEGDEEETFLNDLSSTLSKMRTQNKHFSGKNKSRKRRNGGGDGGPRAKYNRK